MGKNVININQKFWISTKIILKHSKFWLYKSTNEHWLAAKLSCQHQYFFNPLMTHFHSYLKFPTPLSCWVLHYCCSYVFYFMFFTLVLNSNLYTALASYLTTVVISLTLCFLLLSYFTPSSTGSSVMHYNCGYTFLLTLNSHPHLALEAYITTIVTVVIYLVFLLTLNSHLHPTLESYITTVVTSVTLCFYFKPTSTWLLSNTLSLHLRLFTLPFY